MYISNPESRVRSVLERLPKGIGRDYLNGKVTTSHDDVAYLFYTTLCSLPLSEREALSVYKEFTLFQIKLKLDSTFNKPLLDIKIPIPMEKSILRGINYEKADYARNRLKSAISKLCKGNDLSDIQALGLLLGNLMLESGIIIAADQVALLRSLSSGLIALENCWFVEAQSQFPNSPVIGTRRYILDPLSIVIFFTYFDRIKAFLSETHSDKEFVHLLFKAFRELSIATDGENLPLSQYRLGATLEALIRLPGFLYQRVLRKSESYDLPLHAFSRCMDCYYPIPQSDDTAIDFDDEDDSNEGFTEDGARSSGKARAVKSNIITEAQFSQFMEWVNTHPSIAYPERRQLSILFNLAFYCGFRRGEARGLRLKDIYASSPTTAHLRPYKGHTLKTGSATRKVLLEWLPDALLEEIKALVSINPYSERTLLESYSNAPFISNLYEKANNLLYQHFADPTLTVHSLRHSFTSLNLIKLMAGPLRIHELRGSTRIVDDTLSKASSFTLSVMGNLNPSQKLLWSLSKLVGHVDPSTTIRSYTHVLDILTFYGYAYSRPGGYYTRICEISRISNRQFHKHLFRSEPVANQYLYDDKSSFSGRFPFKLLKQLETSIPDAVTRINESFFRKNSYLSDTWKILTELFRVARTTRHPNDYSPILGEEIMSFTRNFIPSQAEIDFLILLVERIPSECLDESLLMAIIHHYDRKQGYLSIRNGFPVKELSKLLRTSKVHAHDISVKAYGSSVIHKRNVRLTNSFSAISRLKLNAQLRYTPKDLKRVPHSAIYWFFCASLIYKLSSTLRPYD